MSFLPAMPHLKRGAVIGGRYRVEEMLGEGGMGHVLRVRHLELDRPFALKILQLSTWSDAAVRRFKREARALGRVRSPRVVQVTDFGVDLDVGPYLVLELVDGETLQARLENDTRLPVREAVQIAAAVGDALVDVHEAGLVHRDVKPSNVVLCDGPVPLKLIDFGLTIDRDDELSRVTESQAIVGSLPYMAPEQFSPEGATDASDQWSLGVLLYQCVTGKLPFAGPTAPALLGAITQGEPSPLTFEMLRVGRHEPPVSEAEITQLRWVISKLLAKSPSERFPTVRSAVVTLRGWLTPEQVNVVGALEQTDTVPPPPAAPAAARTKRWVAAIGSVLAASGLVAVIVAEMQGQGSAVEEIATVHENAVVVMSSGTSALADRPRPQASSSEATPEPPTPDTAQPEPETETEPEPETEPETETETEPETEVPSDRASTRPATRERPSPPPRVRPPIPECTRYVQRACACADATRRDALCRDARAEVERRVADPVARLACSAALDALPTTCEAASTAREGSSRWARDVITEY
jgi:serine/threonine-protein kinase